MHLFHFPASLFFLVDQHQSLAGGLQGYPAFYKGQVTSLAKSSDLGLTYVRFRLRDLRRLEWVALISPSPRSFLGNADFMRVPLQDSHLLFDSQVGVSAAGIYDHARGSSLYAKHGSRCVIEVPTNSGGKT